MVSPLALIESQQLPNAAATLYTSPAKVSTIIKKITLTNTDAAAGHSVTIYLVPAGGAAGAAYLLIDARAVGPLQTLDITEAVNQILAPGDLISAFADTAGEVNIRASGVQIA
jgi:hypothetical protein